MAVFADLVSGHRKECNFLRSTESLENEIRSDCSTLRSVRPFYNTLGEGDTDRLKSSAMEIFHRAAEADNV